jgi:hypothetical protein
MSNYTKATNFAAKDALSPGNANKVVKGTEIDTEFNNIATAIATKANGTLTNFTLEETAGVLFFKSSGTSVAKLDASGNFTVIGNVIAAGTM